MPSRSLFTLALLGGLVLTGCAAPADEATDEAATATADAEQCTAQNLSTFEEGTLTVATDDPAYEPWFADNDPSNGRGYESAVSYVIADRLGFSSEQVTWKRVPFNAVVNPGEHPFDFDVNQVSITEERRKAVDFSAGYYDVQQTVLTTAGSSIAGATSLAELEQARLGAQVGTTSLTTITEQIAPTVGPSVFDTNDAAVQALQNGQLDGIVVDLSTAFSMAAAQLDDGVIVGQVEAEGEVEQFGAVLARGSALTGCVSWAVEELQADGTLAELEAQWLAGAGAPVLTAESGTAPADDE